MACGKKKKNYTVSTIGSPEFINITPSNNLISECEIKVFYIGKNRNGSFINKETAERMANTLPGTPIVGVFRQDIEDFGDHGNVMTIENGEIKFACKTRPYGFVAPDAKVWFQKFLEEDAFGNQVEREYMMTTGYLWTGQYEEAKLAVEQGRAQSMELNDKNIQGSWAEDAQTGLEFFIINDAEFTKLCILGEDVEPCFEGASVTSPDVSSNFTKDESFTQTLFTMMNELKDALKNKGGLNMPEEELIVAEEEAVEVEPSEETAVVEEICEECDNEPVDAPQNEDVEEAQELTLDPEPEPEFAKAKPAPEPAPEEETVVEEAVAEPEPEPENTQAEGGNTRYTAEQYESLLSENEALKDEVEKLRSFKLAVEDKEKDQLIAKYFMLDDEDKAEVIAHKSEYSLAEIESKLALIYVNKNVDFSGVASDAEEVEEESSPSTTFSLDDEVDGIAVDGIARALRATSNKRY